jgi:hypothetical protein
MAKGTSTYLFYLIKSLTKAEKRYFKINYSKGTEGEKSIYSRLFDVIEKQVVYDEKKILANEKYVKNLPALKGRLYDVILRSLNMFYSNMSTEAVIYRWLQHVQILFNKGLYKQASRLLNKIEALAYEKEDYSTLFKVVGWDRRLLLTASMTHESESEIKNLNTKELTYSRMHANLQQYLTLWDVMTLELKINGLYPRTKNDLKKIKELIQSPVMKNERMPLSNSAREMYYNIIGFYEFCRANYKSAMLNFEKRLIVLEQTPANIAEQPVNYIAAINNILICQIELIDITGFYANISKLRSLPAKYSSFKNSSTTMLRIFSRSYSNEILMCIKTLNYEKAFSLTNTVEKGVHQYEEHMAVSVKIEFYYSFALLYFISGNKKKSLFWLNKIFIITNNIARQDTEAFANILFLIIHYEKGDSEGLAYAIKSTYRYLYKHKRIYGFETVLLEYLRKGLPKADKPKAIINSFITLKTKMEKVFQNPFDKNALTYFDFISWLDSKIENQPFADVLKEKYKKQVKCDTKV